MPFLIMIGSSLFGLFGKKGVSDKSASLAGIAALVALAGIAIALFFVIHDHKVIANHDNKINAQVANKVIAADRDAGAKKDLRDQQFRESQGSVNAAVNNAVAAHPAEAKKPVGPASQAYYDELRRQKAKGKHK